MSLVRAAIRFVTKNTGPVVPPPVAGDGPEAGEPPVLVELGDVRDVVLGNSSSGNSDANSQYYW